MALRSFKDWSLRSKTIIPVIVIGVGVAISLSYLVDVTQKQLVLDQARKTATSIANQIKADRKVYTESVVGKLQQEGFPILPTNTKDFSGKKGGILLPASFVHATSELVNAQGLHTADLLSIWNLNPTKGPRNKQESQALQDLGRDPKGFREWVADEGKPTVRYYQVTADIASVQNCVDCHNAHPSSPKKDFRVNDVMGGLVISLPLADEFSAARETTILWTGILLGVLVLITGVIVYIQWHYITKPLIDLEKAAENISLGEMDIQIKTDTTDEVGRLAAAFDRMRRSMKKAMEKLSKRTS